MFCNGNIQRALAVDAYKTLALLKKGFVKDVVKDQLDKIRRCQFSDFDNNAPEIHLHDGAYSTIDIRLIDTDQSASNQTIYTFPVETFVYPLGGDIRITQYTLSDDGEIVDSQCWMMAQEIHFFGRTSETLQCYDLEAVSGRAMLLVGAGKDGLDDIYIAYNKTSLARGEVVSTHLNESRVEYWMTYFSELDITSNQKLMEQVSEQAASRKFKGYLQNILSCEDGREE